MQFSLSMLIAAATFAAGAVGCSAQPLQTQDTVSMSVGDQPIWMLHHAPQEGKPYFHPLAPVGGAVLTDLRPDDHPWHRALWFSWKYIDGVNYWEENRATGQSEGKTRLLTVDRAVDDNGTATITMTLDYAHTAAAPAIVTEQRAITVSAPGKDGVYTIDWTCTFNATTADVLLDRTPLPGEPGGKSWGGYAGLSLRLGEAAAGGTFLNSAGQTDTQAHHQPSEWLLFTAPDGGSALFLDHPTNPTHPSKWYVAPGMPYMSPAILHAQARTLKPGEPFTLSYRLVIAPTKISLKSAQKTWESWAGLH